jgi:oxygen-independent coproporphyrinogen-3 oxidase
LAFGPDTEITLEANPGTVDQKKFKALREAGINRLSLGIQSFQDEKLKQLGRIHGASEAHSAIQAVLAAGFENFNIDLMFGLPQQSLKDALFDLATAIQYQPTHLSWYQLTIEPNTYFAQFPPKLPKDESIWKIQQQGQALLNEHDYCQYEISAYSKQGFHCQHNRNYWEFGDYIGIGAGAHGKLTDPATGKIYRKWKVKHPKQYLTAEQLVAEEKQVLKEDLAFEFFLNAFRLYEAIPLSLMTERTGLTRDQLEPKLQSAQEAGLLQSANNNLTTTPLGKRFLNNLLEIFLNE